MTIMRLTEHDGAKITSGRVLMRLKDGVGIRLDFAEPSTLTAVNLTTARNNGGTIELRRCWSVPVSPLAAATFVDAAAVGRRLTPGLLRDVDAGAGARIALPGLPGVPVEIRAIRVEAQQLVELSAGK